MSNEIEPQSDQPDQIENPTLDIPEHYYAPGALLLLLMVVPFIRVLLSDGSMIDWAVSRAALSEGHWAALQLHMFAHGSIVHIAMNGIALISLAAVVVQKLGGRAESWFKLFFLFEVSGLASAITFLTVHQWNETPMLGASGAIFGLLGFLVRFPQDGARFVPIWSREMLSVALQLAKSHFWLLLIFTVPPLLLGQSGGLAWEAHLGGFVAGLVLAPYLVSERT